MNKRKFNAILLLNLLLCFNIISSRNLRQSHKYKRVFVIVIDSMGIGPMPDSEKYGDTGVDTLGHIAEKQTSFKISRSNSPSRPGRFAP